MDNPVNKINDLIKDCFRLSWDEYFSILTIVSKARSPCNRLHVGCLLVKDNRVISTGYNGFLAGCPHDSIVRNNHEQATIHAEVNAVSDCAKRGVNTEGSIVYITHSPCINCLKTLLSAGIKEIKYLEDYKIDNVCLELIKTSKIKYTKLNYIKEE